VVVSRDCPNFLGTSYYLRTGESYRFQIWPVHLTGFCSDGPSEQQPVKNFREKGEWAYRGTAHFFRVPLLSQERGKLQISNLATTFRASIRIEAHEKFRKKGAWAYIFIMKSYTGYNNRKKKKKLGMCKPQLISAGTAPFFSGTP